jgi:hypothetical protein
MAITPGEWIQTGFTWNGTVLRGIKNGLLDSGTSFSGELSSRWMHFGGRVGVGSWYNGTIDDVMIFNRSLSADEILDIYDSQKHYCSAKTKCPDYPDSYDCGNNPCNYINGCAWNGTACYSTGDTWYVRARTGEYGAEDGLSYETAWDGVNEIMWGQGGVDVGDTLYVCGYFDRDGESAPSALISIAASGAEGKPITIRGDCPGDPGFLVTAMKISSWTDNGDGTYQAPYPRIGYYAWEGTPGVDDRALKPVNSTAKVIANDGSHYWDPVNYVMWYNPHGNPASPKTVYSNWHWAVDGNGHSYITIYNITAYGGGGDRGVIQFDRIGDPRNATYFTVDSCRIKYAATDGIRNGLPGHHYYIVNNTITDFTVGIYIVSYRKSPDNVTISNNYLNHGEGGYNSYWATFRKMSDRGAIAMQPGDDYTITDNHIEKAVDYGIFAFRYGTHSMKNLHILRNRIDEVNDPNDEYYSFGIGLGGGNGAGAGDMTSGMVIAHNIVKNCTRSVYDYNYGIGLRLTTGKHTNPADRPLIYGNIVSGCDTNYRLNKPASPYEEMHSEYVFYNDISYFPNHAHLRVDYALSYDYNMSNNIWYPDSTANKYKFIWQSTPAANFTDFVGKAAADGALIGANSLIEDPMFMDFDNSDFHLQPQSKAIDAGIYAGITKDFEGTPIPQGSAPDIGAFEHVP